MTRRINFTTDQHGEPLILIDDEPQPGLRGKWVDRVDLKRLVDGQWEPGPRFRFVGAYLAGHRQYDADVYVDGQFFGTVPERDAFTEEYYAQSEAGTDVGPAVDPSA